MKLEKYMDFDNPTEEFTGEKQSVQGFSVLGDYGFVLFHTGICAVYDLLSKDPAPVSVFKLKSYRYDKEDKRYTNHANDVVIVSAADGDFMYITAGNSGDADENGYIASCKVEKIIGKDGKFSTEETQTIWYKNDGIEKTKWQTPCWGWPASLPDEKNGKLYFFSARYRTTRAFIDKYADNNYIITVFDLPDRKAGNVTLTPADIVDQFEIPFDVMFTQGGTVHDGKIYYTFGCGEDYPDEVRIVDVKEKKLVSGFDLSGSILGKEELECIAPYKGKFLLNTGSARLYLAAF